MKILVRRGMALGDTVMTSCVLKPLKEKYPDAEIFYESNFPEVFGRGFPWATIIKNADNLNEYDRVFDLGCIHISAYGKVGLPYAMPLPHQACYSCGVRFNPPEILCSMVKSNYQVGICPSTGRSEDAWLTEKFQELIIRLDNAGFKCISFGPKGTPRFKRCLNFYPKYPPERVNEWAYAAPDMCRHVHQSARIMKGLQVVVAGDTGLLHVADAVGASVILLLKRGSPETDFWLGNVHSRIVRSETDLVANIEVETVYNAVTRCLFEKGKLIYND